MNLKSKVINNLIKCFIIQIVFFYTTTILAQKPDVRNKCTNINNCNASNFDFPTSGLQFYLSDINGNPIFKSVGTCIPGESIIVYLSFRYLLKDNPVYNSRLLLDLTLGSNPTIIYNGWIGELPPVKINNQPEVYTIKSTPFNWNCGDEVSFSNPFLFFIGSSNTFETTYGINDYNCSQCEKASSINVRAPLIPYFTYDVACTEGNTAKVTFTNNTVGGFPTYSYNWELTGNSDPYVNTMGNIGPLAFQIGSANAKLDVIDSNNPPISGSHNVQFEVKPELKYEVDSTITNLGMTITVKNVIGGNPPYQYIWTVPPGYPQPSTDVTTLTNLTGGGKFTVKVVDTKGCTKEEARITPVIWGQFSGDFINDKHEVSLNWSVFKEWNNNYFEVQRSINGINAFEKVGTVKAVGFSDEEVHYTFIDKLPPLAGGNLYYRIKQVDDDGKSTFSPTILVKGEPKKINLT